MLKGLRGYFLLNLQSALFSFPPIQRISFGEYPFLLVFVIAWTTHILRESLINYTPAMVRGNLFILFFVLLWNSEFLDACPLESSNGYITEA